MNKEQLKLARKLIKNGVTRNVVASHLKVSVTTLRKELGGK